MDSILGLLSIYYLQQIAMLPTYHNKMMLHSSNYLSAQKSSIYQNWHAPSSRCVTLGLHANESNFSLFFSSI